MKLCVTSLLGGYGEDNEVLYVTPTIELAVELIAAHAQDMRKHRNWGELSQPMTYREAGWGGNFDDIEDRMVIATVKDDKGFDTLVYVIQAIDFIQKQPTDPIR